MTIRSEIQRLRRLVPHWSEHVGEHADEIRDWHERTKAVLDRRVGTLLVKAEEGMIAARRALEQADHILTHHVSDQAPAHDHGHEHSHDHGHKHDHDHDDHHHDHPVTTTRMIELRADILGANSARAVALRRRFDVAGTLAVNLMSSPGAGKTRLLEVTADALGPARMAVIEGDPATENDARRLREKGVSTEQITTGYGCHLDAAMVARGAQRLDIDTVDYIFIENIGNLVCPADFDLGQHVNVVLLSATEGADKPEKYLPIFHSADLVLLTKTDLIPALDDFDFARAETAVTHVQPAAKIIRCSARTGEGIADWLAWLSERAAPLRKQDGENPSRLAGQST